jgi:hypothetical protein
VYELLIPMDEKHGLDLVDRALQIFAEFACKIR